MYGTQQHIGKRLHRRTIAGVMALLYVFILLVPLSVHSKHVAHAITGECSGDCEIDGCALENRSNQTCCCMKKNQQAGAAKAAAGDRSEPKAANKTVVAKGDCSPRTAPEPVKKNCCARSDNPVEHDEDARDEHHAEAQNTNETVYRSGSPCGKGKLQILASSGLSELLPYIYAERMLKSHCHETRYSCLTHLMTSRDNEPPEPPPRQPVTT